MNNSLHKNKNFCSGKRASDKKKCFACARRNEQIYSKKKNIKNVYAGVKVAKKEKETEGQREHEAEERARMLKKEQLMREMRLGALTAKRYRAQWREMMKRLKMPQIIEDVEVAWRNFDRALDIKDYRSPFASTRSAQQNYLMRFLRSRLDKRLEW